MPWKKTKTKPCAFSAGARRRSADFQSAVSQVSNLPSLSPVSTALMAALLWALCFGAGWARAQQLYTGSSDILPLEVERIYLRGINYLAKTQTQNGNWPDQSEFNQPAIAGLAIVSILAHGDDPNLGPYSATLRHGLDFILKHADKTTGYIGTSMYNHGFATLALAESYGVVDDPRLGPALQQAVRLILGSQEKNPQHAWRYSPEASDADTTVSGAQLVALLAARNAGIAVPEKAIQEGLKFFISCQMPGGGVGYTNPNGPNSTRTAIACVVFALAKEKNSPAFKAAFDFFKNAQPDTSYQQYYIYYASQAFFHGSPEAWQSWNRENIKSLRASQGVDGNWEGQYGPTFATAASLLSLALNYRYLPVYER